MALGLLANLNSIGVPKTTVSPASIMTAAFAKTVESPTAVATDERSQPVSGGTSRTQMRPLLIAERNALGAISMANTAHDAFTELGGVLERLRSLVAAGAGSALPPDTIASMQDEYRSLQGAIDTLRTGTTYNGTDLLGPNAQPVAVNLGSLRQTGDSVQLMFSHFAWNAPPASVIGSADSGVTEHALASIDGAIEATVTRRAELLTSLKEIETTAQSIQTQRLNVAAAHSRVRDVAVAEEMAKLSSDLVMRQPGVSILGQGEQLTHLSLGLLR